MLNAHWKGWSKENMTSGNEPGFRDYLLIYTENINKYFISDQNRRDILLITCSTMVDIMSFMGFFRWAMYGTTWRLPFSFVVFYIVRGLI